MDPALISEIIRKIAVFALPVIFAITLHEAAHGYVARYFGDMTAAEAGAVVGVPEGTARTRIRRAKQLLSEQLQAMSETEGKEATRTDLREWARALEDELGPEPRP